MTKPLSEFTKQVIRLIKSVPQGKVATYGQIGKLAGRAHGSRAVCQVLTQHGKTHKLPWFRIINSQGRIAFKTGTKHFKIQKGLLQKEGVIFIGAGRVNLLKHQWNKKVEMRQAESEMVQLNVEDVTRDLTEELGDAWRKLKKFALELGNQRVYTSAKAIMFSREVCYMFIRPKRSYLELVFFLNREITNPALKKPHQVSKTKWGHTMRVIHEDQIEEPLTDWLRESFETASLKRSKKPGSIGRRDNVPL